MFHPTSICSQRDVEIAADQDMIRQMDVIDQGGKFVIERAALGSVTIDCCRCIDTEYAKTSITDIQYNSFNTMTEEGEQRQSLHEVTEGIQCYQHQGKGSRLAKTDIPETEAIYARLVRYVYALGLPVRQLACR